LNASLLSQEWTPVASMLPADGETVLAKTAYGTEYCVTFRSTPLARWEDPHFVRQLEFFQYWKPLP
jgi:hypothetical protein